MLIHFNAIFTQVVPASFDTIIDYREKNSYVLANIITTTVITFCVFAVSSLMLKPLNGLFKVNISRFLLTFLLTMVSALLLSELFFNLNHLITGEDNTGKNHLLFFIKDIFISFIVLLSVYILKTFNEKKAIDSDNQRLKYENLQAQYHSLKNQISPHFLFNSLTALKELIDTDPEISRKYLSHLSHVLRYTLTSYDHRTVSLSDEMIALHSYLFLFQMRFGESLKFEISIDDQFKSFRLPPLVLQTLIENAVKHNEVSRRSPLIIRVHTTTGGGLEVVNELKPRLTTEYGTGIGLANLSQQYKLLNGENIKITRDQNEFKVEVPLLKPE